MKILIGIMVVGFVGALIFLMFAAGIMILDGTDFMDAIVERIRGEE